jgi:hypothetical protein
MKESKRKRARAKKSDREGWREKAKYHYIECGAGKRQ